MKLNRIPFVRIVLFVLIGICICSYSILPTKRLVYGLITTTSVYFIILIYCAKYRPLLINNYRLIFGSLSAICWIISGFLISRYYDPREKKDFIGKKAAKAYIATVNQQPVLNTKTTRCKLEVYQIVNLNNKIEDACGNIEVQLELDSGQVPIEYGQKILIAAALVPAKTPVNPRQFDYGKYLAYKYIFHSQFVKKSHWKILNPNPVFSIKGYSIKTALYFEQILHTFIPFERESAIACALILGYKQQVDDQIQMAYSGAGALHILAVSGMHIALFFNLLLVVFGRIKKIKYGNVLFFVLVLVVIWFYAFITGLSASVLRAAVMFSFILIAQLIVRRINSYNILAASALMMMVFNPNIIFDIGFQLSYLAVIGIFALGKPITNLITPKNIIMYLIWESAAITLAAQVFTFPLCLFYFNQFPNLFLFTNLPLIFLSTLALYAGLFLLLCSPFYWLAFCVGYIVFGLVWLMNQIVLLAAQIPYALSEGIYLSVWELGWMYLGVSSMVLFFLAKKNVWLRISVISFAIINISVFIAQIAKRDSRIWGVYALPRQSMIFNYQSNNNIHLICQDSTFNNYLLLRKSVWPHIIMMGTKIMKKNITPDERKWTGGYGFSIYGKNVLVYNTKLSNKYNIRNPIKSDILIIQNQAINVYMGLKLRIENNCKIIIDNTNSKNYAHNLEKMLSKQGIQVHNVWTLGPYIQDVSAQWTRDLRNFY